MPAMRRRDFLIGAGLAPGLARTAVAQGPPVLVFAAASLKDALDAANRTWDRRATISYAASSALAKQIESGAPADLFLSADEDWMDYLAQRKLIKPDSRIDLLGNSLVLVAPKSSPVSLTVGPRFPLAKALGDGRLALADPNGVPAGRYAKAALQSLGVWDQVAGRIAAAENVRAALLLVDRGEAPLGIVYATDAAADPAVTVVGTFPPSSHPPIVYPMALTAFSSNPDASAFAEFLRGRAAAAAFRKHGFIVLDESR